MAERLVHQTKFGVDPIGVYMRLPKKFKPREVLGDVAEDIHIVQGMPAVSTTPERHRFFLFPRLVWNCALNFTVRFLPSLIGVIGVTQSHKPLGGHEFVAFKRLVEVQPPHESWHFNHQATVMLQQSLSLSLVPQSNAVEILQYHSIVQIISHVDYEVYITYVVTVEPLLQKRSEKITFYADSSIAMVATLPVFHVNSDHMETMPQPLRQLIEHPPNSIWMHVLPEVGISPEHLVDSNLIMHAEGFLAVSKLRNVGCDHCRNDSGNEKEKYLHLILVIGRQGTVLNVACRMINVMSSVKSISRHLI